MLTGATSGLHLHNAGIPTYGHSGLAIELDDNRMHGKDERMTLKSFVERHEYLYRLVKALSSGAR